MSKRLLISWVLKLRQMCRDHSFSTNKYVLKAYHVLGITLSPKNKVVHNIIPTYPLVSHFLVWENKLKDMHNI